MGYTKLSYSLCVPFALFRKEEERGDGSCPAQREEYSFLRLSEQVAMQSLKLQAPPKTI